MMNSSLVTIFLVIQKVKRNWIIILSQRFQEKYICAAEKRAVIKRKMRESCQRELINNRTKTKYKDEKKSNQKGLMHFSILIKKTNNTSII